MIPEDLLYTRQHEWVRIEGKVATIGITDHAQHEMGDLVFVELPNAGDQLQAGGPMGTVESVKAVSEVFCPVTGEVVESNSELLDHPERINEDPHGQGWLARIALAGSVEAAEFMSASDYQAFLDSGGE